VRALARRGSEGKLPAGVQVVMGDALDASTYSAHVAPADTFVHLIGVAHPNPAKARQFRDIDLGSLHAAVAAAKAAGCEHFVFVSVAQPAPVMQAYVRARAECERVITASGLNATILRPWYVLGPGRRWPYLLLPLYWIAEALPATRESARRLGLLTHTQMTTTLHAAVERPSSGVRVLDVPAIRGGAW
jgi:uncharacterized protein YbjT (DUF2867 family)